jgi:hypothetical protein
MKILWMGNLCRIDVHNNQPNRPGYTQYRNRLWGVVYTQETGIDAYTAQCEVGGVWGFREYQNHNTRSRNRSRNNFCSTIRWKIQEHGYRSLLPDDTISSSKIYNAQEHADPVAWQAALQEFNPDAWDQLRSGWMMYLLKNSG